ncbi:DUF2231 domain-containing protein [Nakamurella endophytica]|uniref:DUF2231 domain-containing protein n=1 Tax=Nakamurella endophytica TaxID=1748367 RepID=A0A917SQS2_9ACTN|nr:DUF2231 domain-containing protein [Nakamurella endophytica]GGL90030.1 hypothetical protein GCM10011594_07140 [Nakamurella endophytica]
MFGSVNGLPVHALVLHAAVVLVPVAALVAIAFAVPRWRRVLRWPLVALAAVSLVVVIVARQSGESLRASLGTGLASSAAGPLIAEHQTDSLRLLIATIVLLVVAVGAFVLHSRPAPRWTGVGTSVLLVLVAAAVLFFTYQTGEAGAKAVWNPTGTQKYSG